MPQCLLVYNPLWKHDVLSAFPGGGWGKGPAGNMQGCWLTRLHARAIMIREAAHTPLYFFSNRSSSVLNPRWDIIVARLYTKQCKYWDTIKSNIVRFSLVNKHILSRRLTNAKEIRIKCRTEICSLYHWMARRYAIKLSVAMSGLMCKNNTKEK